MLCILADRVLDIAVKVEQHNYELCLAINDIDHTKTKPAFPQTNGICERFHKDDLARVLSNYIQEEAIQYISGITSCSRRLAKFYNTERTYQEKNVQWSHTTRNIT